MPTGKRHYSDPKKWPRDHSAKHSAAAKKGWYTRTGGYTKPETRAEYQKFRKQHLTAMQEAKLESKKRQQQHEDKAKKRDRLEKEEEQARETAIKAQEAMRKWRYNHAVSPERYISMEMGTRQSRAAVKRMVEKEDKAERALSRVRAALHNLY